MKNFIWIFVAALALALLGDQSALAANITWTGSSGGDWSVGTNWSGGAAPGATNTAVFNTSGTTTVANAVANQSVTGISFDTSAGSFTIGTTGGNSLLLASAGTIQLLSTMTGTGVTETINSPLVIGSATGSTAQTYTFANNYTDNTSTLVIAGSVTGGGTTTGATTITLSGTNTGSNTISGAISNGTSSPVALSKSGAGTWILSGANTYTGNTSVTAGTLQFGSGSAGSMTGSGTISISAGAIAAIGEATGSTITGNISDAGTLKGVETTGVTNTLSGIISGGGTVLQSGAGTTVLSGTNTFTGATTITGGALQLNNTNALYKSPSVTINSTNGLTFAPGLGTFNVVSLDGSANEALQATDGSAITLVITAQFIQPSSLYTGALTGTGGISNVQNVQYGNYAGIVTFTGSNTFTGATSVLGGVFNYQNGQAFGTSSAITESSNTGGSGTVQVQGNIAGGSKILTLTGNGWYSNGALENVSGNNSYAGQINLAGSSTIASDAGALTLLGTINNSQTNTTGTLTLGGVSTGANKVSGIIQNGAGTSTTALVKSGSGNWVLSNANTYTGATTISGGTLELDNANAVQSSVVAVNSTNGLTFNNTASGGNTYNLSGLAGTANESLLDTGSSLVNINLAPTVAGTFSGVLSGAGSTLTMNGSAAGILTLSGSNTFTGATTINSGVINYQNGAAFGTNSAITVTATGAAVQVQGNTAGGTQLLTLAGSGISSAGALESVSGSNSYAGAITMTNSVTVGADAGTLTLSGSFDDAGPLLTVNAGTGATVVISGVLSDSGNLRKNGLGTLVLSGSNTFTGLTSFSSGSSGIINYQNSMALSASPTITLQSGDTVQLQGGISGGSGDNLVLTGSGATGATGALENVSGNNTYAGTIAAATSTISSDSGTLTLSNSIAETGVITATGNGNITISGPISTTSGTTGITKGGAGTLLLLGANTMTGTITDTQGLVDLQANTGSLGGTNGLSFSASGTNFSPGATFNYDNTGSSGAKSQSMGALGLGAGEGTVISTLGSASSSSLTFSSVARAIGAVGNLVENGGTPSTNEIFITGSGTNSFINAGLFFNGSNYAFKDSTGFVRGINYGVDPNSAISAGGTTLASSATGTFSATAGTSNVEITGNITADTATSIKTLQITGTNTFTQTGTGSLSLSGILKSGGGASTISGGILAIAGSTSDLVVRTDTAGDALTIADTISGTNSLTKSGAGALILTGSNTYTGSTYIDAGTLQIGNGGATGSIGAAGAVVNNGLLVYNTTQTSTLGGIISGAGGLTVAAGTLNLNGADTYSGLTTINSGAILQVGNGTAGSISLANNITDNGSLIFDLSSASTYSGVISGTGSLTQIAANALTLSGTNTYTGTTIINSGATITVTGVLNSGTITDSGTLNFSNAGTTTYAGNISGAGVVNQTAGVLTLSGSNSYTGNTSLSGGTAVIGSNTALGTGTVTLADTIQSDGNARTLSNAITTSSETFGGNGNLTLSGTMTDANGGTFTFRNSGTTTLGPLNISTTGKTIALSLNQGGGIVDFAGPVVGTGTASFGQTSFSANAVTLELAGNNALGAGVNINGGNSGYLMIGSDNALGGVTWTFNSTNGIPSQIVLIEADPRSTDTLSNGMTGQIVANGGIAQTTAVGLAGSANLQFNSTVNASFSNQSTGTTIFHGALTGGGVGGQGTGSIILDANSTYTTYGWSDGNSTLTLSGSSITSGSAITLYGGTVILDTGNSNLHINNGVLSLGGVNLVLENISSTSLNTNQTVGSGSTTLNSGQSTISQLSSTGTINLNGISMNTGLGVFSGSGSSSFPNAGGTSELNLAASGIAATTTGNTNGILLPGNVTVGTINNADWATVVGGTITALSSGSYAALSGTGVSTTNYGLVGTGSTAGTYAAQTLKVTSSGAGQSLTLGGTLTFSGSSSNNTSGGLLFTGSNAYTITGGSIAASTSGGISGLTIQQYGSGNLTIASNIGGTTTQNFIKAGPGTLTLTGTSNSYLGMTYVNSGVLSISSDSNLNQVFSGVLSYPITSSSASNTVLAGLGLNSNFSPGAIVLGQTVVGINNSANGFFLSGNANATVTNGSVSFINDPSLVLNGGTLQATSTFNLGSQIGGTGPIYGRSILLGSADGTIDVTGTNTLTVSGIIYGVGSLTKTDTGTLVLTNPNSNYQGGTIVTGGTLQFGVSNALSNTTVAGVLQQTLTNPVIVNGGTVDIAGTTQDFGPLNVLSGSVIDSVGGGLINADSYNLQNLSGTITISAALGDASPRNQSSGAVGQLSAALTKTGTGTAILTANNIYSGQTIITAGVLQIGNNGAAGSLGTANVTDNGSLVFDRSNAYAVTNVISGTGSVASIGSGTVTLSGTNLYSGGTSVSNGTLAINASSNIGSGAIGLATGGTLQYTGTSSGTLSQNITVTGTTGSTGVLSNIGGSLLTLTGTLSKNGTTLDFGSGKFVVAGTITGTATHSDVVLGTPTGSSTVGLTSANTYNGPTTIYNGSTLLTGTVGALPTATPSDVTLGSGTDGAVTNTLDLLGTSQVVNSITASGTATTVNQIISSNGSAATATVGGTFSGTTGNLTVSYSGTTTDSYTGLLGDSNGTRAANNFSLTKTGTGALALTNSNTYTGGTTISAGTLIASNTTGSATGSGSLTLSNGATLQGTGAINASTATISGTLTAGLGGLSTTGSLTLNTTGTASFANTANLVFNLASTAGVDNQLNVGTSAVLFSGSTLTLNLVNSGTTNYTSGSTYILVDGTSNSQYSGLTLSGTNIIGGLTLNLTGTATNGSANAVYYGQSFLFLNNGDIEVQVVPEPGTWALMLGGLALLLVFQRSRRRKDS